MTDKANFLRPVAVLAAALMAGCSMTPVYQRPELAVPARLPAVEGAPVESTASQPIAELPWRSYFKDARLQQVIELALTQNRDLRVAALNIEQTRAKLQVTRADELPTVNAGITGSRGPATSGAIVSTYTAGLSVTAYELDF